MFRFSCSRLATRTGRKRLKSEGERNSRQARLPPISRGLTVYLPGVSTLTAREVRRGQAMIYFEDTIQCDDPDCDICIGLCRESHGRIFGHNRCQQCGAIDCDLMMIHSGLWRRIAEDPDLLLCPSCMDQRLVSVRGCGIAPGDLTDCPLNHIQWPQLMAQQRLAAGVSPGRMAGGDARAIVLSSM